MESFIGEDLQIERVVACRLCDIESGQAKVKAKTNYLVRFNNSKALSNLGYPNVELFRPLVCAIKVNDDGQQDDMRFYFVDRLGQMYASKDGLAQFYYTNDHMYVVDEGCDVLQYIERRLGKAAYEVLYKFLKEYVKTTIINYFWFSKDKIALHIIPTEEGLKHIQIKIAEDPIQSTVTCYYRGGCIQYDPKRLISEQFRVTRFMLPKYIPPFGDNLYINRCKIDRLFSHSSVEALYHLKPIHKTVLYCDANCTPLLDTLPKHLRTMALSVTCVCPVYKELCRITKRGIKVNAGDLMESLIFSQYDVVIYNITHLDQSKHSMDSIIDRTGCYARDYIIMENDKIIKTNLEERLDYGVPYGIDAPCTVYDNNQVILEHYSNIEILLNNLTVCPSDMSGIIYDQDVPEIGIVAQALSLKHTRVRAMRIETQQEVPLTDVDYILYVHHGESYLTHNDDINNVMYGSNGRIVKLDAPGWKLCTCCDSCTVVLIYS